jgi:predicted dehydrogenase
MDPLRIGVVGCGNISGIYFTNLIKFPATEVVACADLLPDCAEAACRKHGIPKSMSPEDLFADPEVELVLNLTTPGAHFEVARRAIESGKHVYNEKPLTLDREEASEVLRAAATRGLLVGCAPDTFLGGSLQTCRRLIDEGAIGEPVSAHGFMFCHGHEGWHPSPHFYYQRGGGPMFDMGPYYLTAMVHLLGGVRRVAAFTRATWPTRTIGSEPRRGETIRVEVPTHVAGLMEFESGAIGELTTSFDVWHSNLPSISVYGSEGSLIVPDPNGFGGVIFIRGKEDRDWRQVPHTHGFLDNSRGLGVLDMAYAIREGRPARAGGDMAYHVLDIMHGFHEAADQRQHVDLESRADRPAALPSNLPEDDLTPQA